MLLGNEEKTIKLYAENFLQGHITFDYGTSEDERMGLPKASYDLSKKIIEWLNADKKNDKSEEHQKNTRSVYRHLLSWRIRGRITGKLVDVDLESTIEGVIGEKNQLEGEIKAQKQDILKAIKELKDNDRVIAGLEAQIFYLKKE